MSEASSSQNDPTEVDNLYRRLSALDSRRPGEWVRRKVQAYAAQQAAERTLRESTKPREIPSTVAPVPAPKVAPAPRAAPAAKVETQTAAKSWLLPAVLGGVAVAAIVGFLIVPSLIPRHAPSSAALPPPPVPLPLETTREVTHAPSPSSDESASADAPSDTAQSSEPNLAESPPSAAAPTSVAAAPPAPTSPAANSVAAGSSVSPPPAATSGAAASSHGQSPAKTRVARQPPAAPPVAVASRSAPAVSRRVEAAPQASPVPSPANNSAAPVQAPVSQVAQTQPPPAAPEPAPPAAVPVAIQPASTPVSAPAASVSSTPSDGFWHAAEVGDLATVRGVIASNADVNALDPKGHRALILAIDHGQVTVVRELLAHGANPKLSDAHGVTPQIAAHARGNFEILTAVERSLKGTIQRGFRD